MSGIYVVWSNEHQCWWGPDCKGYRRNLADAGKYSRDDAIGICRGARGGREFNSNPSEVPLLLEDAVEFWGDDRDDWERARNQRRREREEQKERELAALLSTTEDY